MDVRRFALEIPSIETVLKSIEELRGLGAEVSTLGTSEEGRPIYCIRVGGGRVRIAIVAGQHGSEPAPILASIVFLYKLLRDELRPKLRRREVLESCQLMVVPLSNPDGFAKLGRCLEKCGAPNWSCDCVEARLTNNYEDMNRDWLVLRNACTRAIHRALMDFDPHVVLDLHEFYAREGSPPKWAHETEGFDAYVTDTPYLGVSPEIMSVSAELAEMIRSSIESATGWKTKILRPGDGLIAVPPIYLGSHVPFEGCAKVLVESWGVGLGNYLLYERVSIHTEAITTAVAYALERVDDLSYAKAMDRRYDRAIGESFSYTYVIKGYEVDRAEDVLREHRIEARREGSRLVVPMPQKFSRLALMLLEPSFIITKLLEKRGRSVLLTNLFEVSIERVTA